VKDLRFGKSAKDDRFTQRRTTVTREELPVVPMFPGVAQEIQETQKGAQSPKAWQRGADASNPSEQLRAESHPDAPNTTLPGGLPRCGGRRERPVQHGTPAATESLGCEGDSHLDAPGVFEAMGLDPLPAIPVFRAYAAPAPSPTHAELPQPAPGPAATARWALWSDGTLDLHTPDGWVHLGAEQTRELQRYLAKMGG
jgi:hypothetical protein